MNIISQKCSSAVVLLIFTMVIVSCAGQALNNSAAYDGRTPVEITFNEVSKAHQIPERMLIAIAYMESLVNSKSSSANNILALQSTPEIGQSAFGISRAELELPDGEEGSLLSAQIKAYGTWVANRIPGGLRETLVNDEEKFNWIWNFAELHRDDDSTRSLFARELIRTLNSGFHWIDPESQKVIEFRPESPSIETKNLRRVSQNHLQLTNWIHPSLDDVYSARYIARHNQHNHGVKQNPRSIEIIHCPFSFSACIEMQSYDGIEEKDFWLGAHYIIPSDDSLFNLPLQVSPHKNAVPRMQEDGSISFSNDKVIIMLTGLAGRIVDGKRLPANPSWFTSWQLQQMGKLAQGICDRLFSKHVNTENPLSLEECLASSSRFYFQGDNEGYKWGHIPDFDSAIFNSYIKNPELLAGKAVFEFPGGQKIFSSNEGIRLNLTFGLQVKHIQVDRLIRCPDSGRVLWLTEDRAQVRAELNYLIEKNIYDAGPNMNGSHFFRAKVFADDGTMLGWDLATVFIDNYEKSDVSIVPNACK